MPIREPLFAGVVLPVLLAAYDRDEPGAARALLDFEQQLQGNQRCERLIGDRQVGRWTLFERALEQEPHARDLLERWLALCRRWFEYATHEVPSGILSPDNSGFGATASECEGLLADVDLFERRAAELGVLDDHVESIARWRYLFAGYREYLLRQAEFDSFWHYLQDNLRPTEPTRDNVDQILSKPRWIRGHLRALADTRTRGPSLRYLSEKIAMSPVCRVVKKPLKIPVSSTGCVDDTGIPPRVSGGAIEVLGGQIPHRPDRLPHFQPRRGVNLPESRASLRGLAGAWPVMSPTEARCSDGIERPTALATGQGAGLRQGEARRQDNAATRRCACLALRVQRAGWHVRRRHGLPCSLCGGQQSLVIGSRGHVASRSTSTHCKCLHVSRGRAGPLSHRKPRPLRRGRGRSWTARRRWTTSLPGDGRDGRGAHERVRALVRRARKGGLGHRDPHVRLASVSGPSPFELHELCDVNPEKIHITLPASSHYRPRRRGGERYVVHHEDLDEAELTWHEGIRIVTPAIAIRQANDTAVPTHLVHQAIETAERLGRVPRGALLALTRRLDRRDEALAEPFDGITFRRTEPVPLNVPGRLIKPRRLDVRLSIRGRIWRRIRLEVSPDEASAGDQVDELPAPSLAHFGVNAPTTTAGSSPTHRAGLESELGAQAPARSSIIARPRSLRPTELVSSVSDRPRSRIWPSAIDSPLVLVPDQRHCDERSARSGSARSGSARSSSAPPSSAEHSRCASSTAKWTCETTIGSPSVFCSSGIGGSRMADAQAA